MHSCRAAKQLSAIEKNAQIKQALLLTIEMGLKFKFSDEAVRMLSDISAINNIKLLEVIASQNSKY